MRSRLHVVCRAARRGKLALPRVASSFKNGRRHRNRNKTCYQTRVLPENGSAGKFGKIKVSSAHGEVCRRDININHI